MMTTMLERFSYLYLGVTQLSDYNAYQREEAKSASIRPSMIPIRSRFVATRRNMHSETLDGNVLKYQDAKIRLSKVLSQLRHSG